MQSPAHNIQPTIYGRFWRESRRVGVIGQSLRHINKSTLQLTNTRAPNRALPILSFKQHVGTHQPGHSYPLLASAFLLFKNGQFIGELSQFLRLQKKQINTRVKQPTVNTQYIDNRHYIFSSRSWFNPLAVIDHSTREYSNIHTSKHTGKHTNKHRNVAYQQHYASKRLHFPIAENSCAYIGQSLLGRFSNTHPALSSTVLNAKAESIANTKNHTPLVTTFERVGMTSSGEAHNKLSGVNRSSSKGLTQRIGNWLQHTNHNTEGHARTRVNLEQRITQNPDSLHKAILYVNELPFTMGRSLSKWTNILGNPHARAQSRQARPTSNKHVALTNTSTENSSVNKTLYDIGQSVLGASLHSHRIAAKPTHTQTQQTSQPKQTSQTATHNALHSTHAPIADLSTYPYVINPAMHTSHEYGLPSSSDSVNTARSRGANATRPSVLQHEVNSQNSVEIINNELTRNKANATSQLRKTQKLIADLISPKNSVEHQTQHTSHSVLNDIRDQLLQLERSNSANNAELIKALKDMEKTSHQRQQAASGIQPIRPLSFLSNR